MWKDIITLSQVAMNLVSVYTWEVKIMLRNKSNKVKNKYAHHVLENTKLFPIPTPYLFIFFFSTFDKDLLKGVESAEALGWVLNDKRPVFVDSWDNL